MSEQWTQISIEDELMSSPVDSPVSRSVLREREKAKRTNATCGRRCLELSESVVHDTWLAKMSKVLLGGRTEWFSKRCALTWKILGTPSNRILYQLVPRTLPTNGCEFGLLLTPTTIERAEHPDEMRAEAKGYKNGTKFNSLMSQIVYGTSMLPTPTAQQERSNPSVDRGKGNLSDEIAKRYEIGGKTSQLSPLFVEEMMGFPKNWTALPFQSGEDKV